MSTTQLESGLFVPAGVVMDRGAPRAQEFATPPAELPPGALNEIGVLGLDLSNWGLARDAVRPELSGRTLRTVIREMLDTDPTVGAMFYGIQMMIRQVEWEVMPAEGDLSDEGREAAEFVRTCLHDMNTSWANVLTEVLSFLAYGWSYFELVYKIRGGFNEDGRFRSAYDDGLVGWRKWAIRRQDSLDHWEFDPDGGVRGMWQIFPPKFEPVLVPIEKSVLFRTQLNGGHPEGRSVLLNAIRPYRLRKRAEEFEAIGMERDLAGYPMMKVPAKLLAANLTDPNDIALRDALIAQVTGVRRNQSEGMMIPSDPFQGTSIPQYSFELVSSGGGRQYQTDQIIDRLNKSIAMTLLMDWLYLGQGRVGSYALSSDKTDLFAVMLGTHLENIGATINTHVIPRLFQFKVNADRFPNASKRPPRIMHKDIESQNLEELGGYVTKLKGIEFPLFPNKALETYLLESGHLPLPTEEERAEQEKKAEEAAAQGQPPAGQPAPAPAANPAPANPGGSSTPPTEEATEPDAVPIGGLNFHYPGGKAHNQKNHTRHGYIKSNLKLAKNVDKGIIAKIGKKEGHAHFNKGTDVTGPKSELKAKSAPKAKPQPKPKADELIDTAKMKKIGGQGGSNPGGLFEAPDGTRWYVKGPNGDPDTVKRKIDNEILAGKLYEMAGVPVAELRPAKYNGQVGIASKVVDVDDLGTSQMKGKGVTSAFAVDAWLANWDVIGNGSPGQMNLKRNKDTKEIMRLDTGGALLYRAMGAPKGAAFGNKVGEISTFRSASTNPNAAKVFGKMTNREVAASIDRVLALPASKISQTVLQYGPGSRRDKLRLLETLLNRQADLAQQKAKLLGQ